MAKKEGEKEKYGKSETLFSLSKHTKKKWENREEKKPNKGVE